MKRIVLLLEGALKTQSVTGKTPLEAADTPALKRLTRRGQIGAVRLLPSDIRLPGEALYLSALGYDPRLYRGRGPILAAALRVILREGDVAFCSPLISTDGSMVQAGVVPALTDEEALGLMEVVAQRLSTSRLDFYAAPQNNSLLRFAEGPMALATVPPRRMDGKSLKEGLPQGEEEERLQGLIYDSLELLAEHPINQRRIDEGLLPANTIWPYGQGARLVLPAFPVQRGVAGAVISANLLIQGIARVVGLSAIPPLAESGAALVATMRSALKAGNDFVLLPLSLGPIPQDSPDEVRQEQIERIDREVIEPLLLALEKGDESFRILCIATETGVSSTSAPFLLYDVEREQRNDLPFDERAVPETRLIVEEGHRLLDRMFR